MGKKIYRLVIEPLTCVHVGTGKQLTLLDYTVREMKSGEDLYMKFSSDSILNRIATDSAKVREFEIASSSGNMKDLQSFFQNNFSANDDLEYPCETTKEFSELYLINKTKDSYENGAIVEQIYRPAGKKGPVIPGSSIKGCIRTAILNYLMDQVSDKTYYKYIDHQNDIKEKFSGNSKKINNELSRMNNQIQKELLENYKDGKNDPFRAIEFTDCSFPIKNSQITGVLKTVSVDQSTGELFISNSTQILVEAIKGSLMRGSESADCLLRLNTDLMKQDNGVTKAFNKTDIINSCNYFFWREFQSEYESFYKEATDCCDLITKLKQELNEIRNSNSNQFIIRLGRWSQVEFITFDENLRAPQNKKYGTTRTVLNYDGQYLPFGWCKCSLEEVK